MPRKMQQKRYSQEFKRKVMEEFRQGKWDTPYAIARAYDLMPATARAWIDAAGLTHLRSRAIEIKTLSEVSELHRLRKENKKLRDQLLEEVLSCREERAMLVAAGKEYGFCVAEFRLKYKAGDGKAD